jgi:hypothetical protein
MYVFLFYRIFLGVASLEKKTLSKMRIALGMFKILQMRKLITGTL